jgi:hypothetical protein
MYSRDYILRMIEQMGQALIALRNSILGRKRSSEEIGDKLRSASRQVGFDLDLARAATPETIMMLIAPFGEVEPGRCWMVAEVLYLDGLQAQMEERMDDAAASFEKALPLYELLEPGALHLALPEARERVREIEHALRCLEAGGTPDVPPAIEPEGA